MGLFKLKLFYFVIKFLNNITERMTLSVIIPTDSTIVFSSMKCIKPQSSTGKQSGTPQ
jgi:N-glycosylase/DNA lyase